MRFRAVVFDMDGLMLDTEPAYKVAWQRAVEDCGQTLKDAFYPRLIGRSRASGEQLLQEEFGPDFSLQAFQVACRKHEATVLATGQVEKKPGLDELLAFLDSTGTTMAVATSTEKAIAEPLLAATGLLGRFRVLVAGDEVSASKPAPEIFLLAAQRLTVQNTDCLVLEDSEAGVIAAHRAGMHVYMIPDLVPPSAATRSLASETFDSLLAVIQHLKLTER